MSDIKEVIAANLIRLRQQAGLTQLQLAEMLNYSDKAVSKWERGESVPDIRILVQLADIYHITVDDIVREPHGAEVKPRLNLKQKHALISILSAGLVWLVAAGIFMILWYVLAYRNIAYLTFVVAPFISFVVLTVFSALWAKRIWVALSCSGIVWSAVLIVHVFLNVFGKGIEVWPFYIVAAALEILLIGWFVLRRLYKPKKKN